MENLINQIAGILSNDENVNVAESRAMALKEIIFSGMSRCNFFKNYAYICDEDHHVNQSWYFFFSKKNSLMDEIDQKVTYIQNELNAWGIFPEINLIPDGYKFIFDENLNINLIGCLFEGHEPTAVIRYKQVPVPYEIYEINNLSDSDKQEIENYFQNLLKKEKKTKKTKTSAEKKEKKKKQPEVVEEKWSQPSLFDF